MPSFRITQLIVAAVSAALIAVGSTDTASAKRTRVNHTHPHRHHKKRHRRRHARHTSVAAGADATRLFAPDSVWNSPLSQTAALDPASGPMSAGFQSEVASELHRGIGPWIETGTSSTPIYRVGANTPLVAVAVDPGILNSWRVPLQAAFQLVPIPGGAQPAAGPDAHMTIWQPSTDTLWEFFKARHDASGWHAKWGGAIRHVSQSPGYYSASSWPGLSRPNWGATATSLPVAGGVITLDDLKAGQIDHALAINLPYPRAGVYAWPAQRSDGTGTDPNAIPEGAHLRLDPKLDLSKLSMPPLVRMMAEAAQRYGMIVRDQTHHATGFFIEDPTPSGSLGLFYDQAKNVPSPNGYFSGRWPSTLMRYFPWSAVQVLKMQLRDSRTGAIVEP